jgi:hypothetical protein
VRRDRRRLPVSVAPGSQTPGNAKRVAAYITTQSVRVRIMKTGRWLYDGSVYGPVDIVALDFDYWYEIAPAEGALEEGELPETPDDGEALYYVRYRDAGKRSLPSGVDSAVSFTISDAMRTVEQTVQVSSRALRAQAMVSNSCSPQ